VWLRVQGLGLECLTAHRCARTRAHAHTPAPCEEGGECVPQSPRTDGLWRGPTTGTCLKAASRARAALSPPAPGREVQHGQGARQRGNAEQIQQRASARRSSKIANGWTLRRSSLRMGSGSSFRLAIPTAAKASR
jgi:hypothetical protein